MSATTCGCAPLYFCQNPAKAQWKDRADGFEYVARRAGGKKGREEDSSPGKKRECTAGLVSLFCLFFKVSNVTKCSKVCSFQGQGQNSNWRSNWALVYLLVFRFRFVFISSQFSYSLSAVSANRNERQLRNLAHKTEGAQVVAHLHVAEEWLKVLVAVWLYHTSMPNVP